MAFPFEPTQLRAQLRAFALSTTDDSNSAARIVKPLVLGLYYDQCNQEYLRNFRPISPPIPSELPVDVGYHAPLQLGHHKRLTRKPPTKPSEEAPNRKNASPIVHAPSEIPQNGQSRRSFVESVMSVSTVDEVSDDLNITISESRKEKKKRPKDKLRNPLTKLFQKNDESRHDDSDSSSGQITLESDNENGQMFQDSSSLLIIPSDESKRLEKLRLEDGELVIVAEMETGIASTLKTRDESLVNSFAADSDKNTVEDSIIEEELDESSSDSAFTDIEADSMMEGNSIYEYTVPESYVLEEAKSKYDRKRKGRKLKRNSGSLLGKSGKPLATDSLLAEAGVDAYSKSSLIRTDKGTPLIPRRSSFTFEKIYNKLDSEPKQSNLSVLIDSRQSSKGNVLSYYSFVKAELIDDPTRAKIDIYVPPATTPAFENMGFSANVPITDCIGYILLSLSKLPEYKDKLDVSFMNPNNWRLELIDEDGELYDSSFGVLDRTRLLSSYNSPNLLALCRVTNPAEIASNNKQSPLPLKFKQDLDLKEQRLASAKTSSNQMHISPGAANLHDDSIEVKVTNLPNTSGAFISFFVNSKITVEQFIDHISHLYHFDPTKYSLAELAPSNKPKKSTMLIDDSDKVQWRNPATNSDVLAELTSQKFKLVPNLSNGVKPESKLNPLSYSEAAITPSTPSFAPLAITPPVTSLAGKFEELTTNSNEKPLGQETKTQPPGKADQSPKPRSDLLSFGDIIHAKTSQLPTSLNTIYFKWKVFRKKSPILNRIEKALILDGDHIHLAPTDDTTWKKNPYENPFTQNSSTGNSSGNSHHHHHYLHHYNYSKYYSDTMMKTSSFHITQIIKLKQYKQSKNPNHFKIVIRKEYDQGGKETVVKKKYDLEAQDVVQCEEIIEKIKWALQVYNMSNIT